MHSEKTSLSINDYSFLPTILYLSPGALEKIFIVISDLPNKVFCLLITKKINPLYIQ